MLTIENLEVSYGQIKALKGISLHVEAGSIVTLVGANGAGKSTLLKTISGLLKVQSGSIIYQGELLNKMDSDTIVKKGCVQVPEGRRIFAGMTVYENLLLGAYTRSDKANIKQEIDQIFQRFSILKQRSNQDANTLSGGEQQMLAISRALLSKPKLLLLDEPSMGLAPLVVKQIFEMIQELNKQGITILLVEQNAKKALEISDYAYIIESGVIKLEGKSREIGKLEKVKDMYLGS